MLGRSGVLGQGHHGLVQELLEVGEGGVRVAARVGGHAVEGGDEVGVDVVLVLTGVVEVVEETPGVRP